MGTPDFAVPSLRRLHASEQDIVGVVTVPDKPRGRGQRMLPSAVKKAAKQLQLPVIQPTDLGAKGFLKNVRSLEPDLMVVVAFRILPESCYTLPHHGAINLHASLLPKYRGAAPIQRAIMNGESQTGVTTFFLERTVDTGEILVQRSIDIGPEENAGSVHDRLAELGSEVVLETVKGIEAGALEPSPQKDTQATKAPKITKEDLKIIWSKSVQEVHNQIRALSPYPGAFTMWNETRLTIYKGRIGSAKSERNPKPPGTIIEIDNGRIQVACRDGIYDIMELKPAGKRRMTALDFCNGYPVKTGERFH